MWRNTFTYFIAIVLVAPSPTALSGQLTGVTDMGSSDCSNQVQRSTLMIKAILDDIDKNYNEVGGGGITDIRLTQTSVYVVSIAQEERIDKITYELEVTDDCRVDIKSKKISAASPWDS